MTIYEMAQKYYPRLIDGFEWFEPLPDEKKIASVPWTIPKKWKTEEANNQ